MHVLVTGAAGAIGVPVCAELERRGHRVRGLDRRSAEAADFVQADIADRQAVESAMRGIEAVVHLAAMPDDGPFDELVAANVSGLHHVLDAARRAGVRRVALASSIQVIFGRPEREDVVTAEARYPTNHYALTKLWAEQMGEMYARCYGMGVVAARIGWMVRNRREAELIMQQRALSHYVSRADTARFFAQAIEAPSVDFAVLYVLGPGGSKLVDLETARRVIGYEPRDEWPRGLPADAADLA
ncbi:MAG TPA: NAD(P)-dependent oxidoreductase [Polyangiaceae bacterium]|nr:NAD(P)-dependent oxidoreductase [Polyangiaceae bacterium]